MGVGDTISNFLLSRFKNVSNSQKFAYKPTNKPHKNMSFQKTTSLLVENTKKVGPP